MVQTNVWNELGRNENELLLGDTFLTKSNKLRTIVMNPKRLKDFTPGISLEDAQALLESGEILAISDSDGVLYDL